MTQWMRLVKKGANVKTSKSLTMNPDRHGTAHARKKNQKVDQSSTLQCIPWKRPPQNGLRLLARAIFAWKVWDFMSHWCPTHEQVPPWLETSERRNPGPLKVVCGEGNHCQSGNCGEHLEGSFFIWIAHCNEIDTAVIDVHVPCRPTPFRGSKPHETGPRICLQPCK